MEEERELTRLEMQEIEAKNILECMSNLSPDLPEYKELLERYNAIMETINKEKELDISRESNSNEKMKSFTSVAVGVLGVVASFAFGFKTDKKTEEGDLPQKRQTWKISEWFVKSFKR